MNTSKLYYYYDKNSYINNFSSPNIIDIFHEILCHIDDLLTQLLSLDIKISTDKLNFDNLMCIETLNCINKSNSFIVNTYTINMKDMVFISQFNNNKYYMSSINELTFITSSVMKKMDGLNGNKKLVQPNIRRENPIEQTKKKSNVHNLLTDTKSILNNISDSNKTQIQPNVIRPMESILFEENENDDDISIDPIELKKTIEELKKKKDDELKKLEQLKEQNKKDIDKFSESNNKFGDLKRELKRNLEREQEKRHKFEANKSAYRKIKQDIDDGKLTENKISELFVKEYPIYKFMDEKNMLDSSDDYIIFSMMYDEMTLDKTNKTNNKEQTTDYIPHNYHYLNDDEQNKYKNIYNDNKDMIEEFISKQTTKSPRDNEKNTKTYPPLEEILNEIDNDNDIPDFE